MFCPPVSQKTKTFRVRFTHREIDYLEQKCGLHLNHLVRFIESILSDAYTHNVLMYEHELKRVFLKNEVWAEPVS